MALAEDTIMELSPHGENDLELEPRPNVKFYGGGLIAHRAGSDLAEIPNPSAARNDLIIVGYNPGYLIDTTGAATDSDGGALQSDGITPYKVTARPGIIGPLATGTSGDMITADMIGLVAFAVDDNTVYATSDGNTLSPAGIIDYVDPVSGYVWIEVDANPILWAIFGVDAPEAALGAALASTASGQGTALIGDHASGLTLSALLATLTVKSIQFVQDAGTLAAGTHTVNTGITVTASSVFLAIRNNPDATAAHWGKLSTATPVVGGPGTGAITINSSNAADTSTVSLIVLN